MLHNRTISTEIGGIKQSIVLFPLLWRLVFDDLLNLLKDSALGYADDIVICVTRWHGETLVSRMQNNLNLVMNWCNTKGLSFNPEKTALVPFTRKYKINIKIPIISGEYLGVIFDKKLN